MITKEILEIYGVNCVDWNNIISSGANPEKLNVEMFVKLQKFQNVIQDSFYVVKNGLNSGTHKPGGWHYKSLAVDIAFYTNLVLMF